MKHKLLTASAAFPLAMMLGGGAIYCLITAFDLPVEDPKLLLTVWALCAVGGCVLFSIPKAGLPAVAASASAMFWLWSSWEIALPFRALICRISVVYDQGYGWGAVRFAGLDWESMTLDPLFACWGGALALVAVAAVIKGRGGTNFTPVFDLVEKLRKGGALKRLKGLLYFTDGDGVYPRRPTPYETAFVFTTRKALERDIPKWIIPLCLERPERRSILQEGPTL